MSSLTARTDAVVARMLALIVCAAAIWLATAGSALGAVTYQQNAAHTGYSPKALGTLTERWHHDFPNEVVGYPLVADGRVIVVTWGEEPTPWLRAFDEVTGRPLWSNPLTTTSQLSEPAYDDGTIFLATSGIIKQSSAVGYMEAYDAATGARKWRSEPHDRSIHDLPVVAGGGKVFMQGASSGTGLLAFDQQGGTLLWERRFGGGSESSPTLADGRAFLSHGPRTSAIRQADGSVAWARNGHLYGSLGRTSVASDGLLYELDPLNWAGRISDAATGVEVATFPGVSNNSPPPAVGPDMWVYLANDRLIGRRVGSNEQVWTFDGDGSLRSTPLIVGDTVYVGSTSGRVFGVSLATGREVWADATGDPFRRVEDNQYSLWAGFGASERSLVTSGTHRLTAYAGQGATAPTGPSTTTPQGGVVTPATGPRPGTVAAAGGPSKTRPPVRLTRTERRACERHLGTLAPTKAGTENAERIRGTSRRDAIAAGAGRDRIAARDRGDCVGGGPDGDHIDGGGGRDVLLGGAGSDTLVGGADADKLLCGPGRDTVYAGPGDRYDDCERVVRVRR